MLFAPSTFNKVFRLWSCPTMEAHPLKKYSFNLEFFQNRSDPHPPEFWNFKVLLKKNFFEVFGTAITSVWLASKWVDLIEG